MLLSAFRFVLLLALLACTAFPAQAASVRALVIGIDAYQSWMPLDGGQRDAQLFSKALRGGKASTADPAAATKGPVADVMSDMFADRPTRGAARLSKGKSGGDAVLARTLWARLRK